MMSITKVAIITLHRKRAEREREEDRRAMRS